MYSWRKVAGVWPLNEVYLRIKFRREIALLKGRKVSESNHPSIIHMSLNKSATQFVRRLLYSIAREEHLIPINLSAYSFHTDLPYLNLLKKSEFEKYEYLINEKGFCYSSFGGPLLHLNDPNPFLKVIIIRDPRDVLVSEYFSFLFSHRFPLKTSKKVLYFEKQRHLAEVSTIDDYVLMRADKILKIFQKYMDALVLYNENNVFLTKYEDLIQNRSSWLLDLVHFVEADFNKESLEYIKNNYLNIFPSTENPKRHLRKGVAGDYKEKLKSETIEKLNDKFESVFSFFGYAK